MSCPYASQNKPTASEALTLAKNKCPAFKDGSCPFRDAHTSDELKEKLRSVPPSHDDDDSIRHNFRVALEHMHEVGQELITAKEESHKYLIDGGCPFKGQGSFRDAMETFSLMAVMGEMASEVDRVNSGEPATIATIQEDKKGTKNEQKRRLSSELKTGTAASHRAAENVHFVRNFIRGKIDRGLYSHLVSSLYFVYVTLEDEINKHGPKFFPSLHHPDKLSRRQNLEKDMEFFFGDEWKDAKPSPATVDYQNRIRDVAATNPILLLSHGYTRYLGDLSGGRVLQRVAKKALSLSSNQGLSFYDFDNIPDPKSFKNEYRKSLDDLELNEREVKMLVAEANLAFVLNVRVFEELDVRGGVEGASVRSLDEALKFVEGVGIEEKGDGKCPFADVGKMKKVGAVGGECPMKKTGVCPWPFLLMHDPKKGLRKFQSFLLIGLVVGILFGNDPWRWPLIFIYDPVKGLRDPQTIIIALAIGSWYIFARENNAMSPSKQHPTKNDKKCPWPFVFFHDPKQGMGCYQTWIVMAFISSYIFNQWSTMTSN